MSVPINHKFACLSFHWMSAEIQAQPFVLSDGLSVHSRPPFDLDDTWTEWLGTLAVEKLRESNFIILAAAPSANASILDNEHEALDKAVYRFWYATLLHGVPDHEGLLSFQGSNVDGALQVRGCSNPFTSYKPRYIRPIIVDHAVLQSADAVASGIRSLYSAPGSYVRLKKGFSAWLAGIRERHGDARLHQFVRAVEALIKPTAGRTKRNFEHRGQLFLGGNDTTRELLGELFDLRSAAEHMNDFGIILNRIPEADRERSGWLRSYQTELLAGRLYARLLSNPIIFKTFRDDKSIEEFWTLRESEQRTLWGDPLDLQRLVAARHTTESEPGAAPIDV